VVAQVFRIGVDENGLGSRIGPLVVTGVLARVDERGEVALRRKLPKSMRESLDDSKRLVSHKDFTLGEAWARVLTGDQARYPSELFACLSLEGVPALQKHCPEHVGHQCWNVQKEEFEADEALVARVQKHRAALEKRGIEVLEVRSSLVCTERLNHAKERGGNRFISDLHAMEALVLELRKRAGSEIGAVCGKVGGIGQYGKFFGPLAGWLHVALEEGQAKSTYRFPTLGEVSFVRDADAKNPLVMLASLVGKYVRELFMGRIARYYGAIEEDGSRPSGYHDPVTAAFVESTALVRKKKKIPVRCFERARDTEASGSTEIPELAAQP
jgi:ribonuclease HII